MFLLSSRKLSCGGPPVDKKMQVGSFISFSSFLNHYKKERDIIADRRLWIYSQEKDCDFFFFVGGFYKNMLGIIADRC